MRCLITGGSGFVGRALVSHALAKGYNVRCPLRQPQALDEMDGVETVKIGSLSVDTDWTAALCNIEKVVHLAARVHVMNEMDADPLAEFRRVNVEATANLARQAVAAGVRRFVYLSSIKVNGEYTETGRRFTADDVPAPEDPYGVSKHEAEQLLRQIGSDSGMEVVIIRPPLVYGPGVKANFESMMGWLFRGVPLPLGGLSHNRRSLVALDNLVDLIVTCLNHPAAANETFLVSDGEDLSTVDLLRRMGAALGQPAHLFHMPPSVLRLGAQLVNKPGIYQRLCGSLQLDIAKTKQLLDWTPPVSVNEGLLKAAQGFRR